MPDQPQEPKPTLLRAYLASRDLPCEACGYNLRGVQDVFCPECGAVIPRPPTDAVDRFTAAPESLKLYCTRCGYTITGTDAQRCPECGKSGLERFSGDQPPPRSRWRVLPRGLPVPIAGLSATGALVAASCATLAIQERVLGPLRPGRAIQLALAAALALSPAAIMAAWMLCWRPLAAMNDWPRRAWFLGASVLSAFLLLLAVLEMR